MNLAYIKRNIQGRSCLLLNALPFEIHLLLQNTQVYYHTILLPFSRVIGFKKLDAEALNFHYAEDLLEMVTIAIGDWINNCLAKHHNITVMQWLHAIKSNRPAYETAYACIHYFVPYWLTRASIKWNRVGDVEESWRYWTHLFIATGKNNYSLMSVRFLWMLSSLNPAVKALYDQYHVLSFTGEEGSGNPMDTVEELVCSVE